MNNNGFFGFGTVNGYDKDYLTGLNNQNNSIIGAGAMSGAGAGAGAMSGAGAGAGAVIGAGIDGLGSLMDIFNQVSVLGELSDQGRSAYEQFQLQIKQIESNQAIRDLASTKQANNVYATTLAKQGNSNISQTSSSSYSAFNDISKQIDIMNFSSNMTATTQKINTYLQQSNYFRELDMKMKQSKNAILGDAMTSAMIIAALILI